MEELIAALRAETEAKFEPMIATASDDARAQRLLRLIHYAAIAIPNHIFLYGGDREQLLAALLAEFDLNGAASGAEVAAALDRMRPVWPDDTGGPAHEWLGLSGRVEPGPLAALLPAEPTLWYDELGRPTTTEPAIGIPAGNPVFVTTDSKRRRGTSVSAVSARAGDGATIRLSPRYDHARIRGKRLTLVHAIYGDHSGLRIDASEPCGAGLVYRCHAEGPHWFWRMEVS